RARDSATCVVRQLVQQTDSTAAGVCEQSLRLQGASQRRRFLSLDEGICIDSRYLATVRRATLTPVALSSSTSLLSDSGLRGGSSWMSFLIMARIAVLE